MCARNNISYKYALEWMGHANAEILDLHYRMFDDTAEIAMKTIAYPTPGAVAPTNPVNPSDRDTRAAPAVMEIDPIKFTAGANRGNYGVRVKDGWTVTIFDNGGDELITWDGNRFQLDRARWTPEMIKTSNSIDANPWTFAAPTDKRLKDLVMTVVARLKVKPAVLFANAPQDTTTKTATGKGW